MCIQKQGVCSYSSIVRKFLALSRTAVTWLVDNSGQEATYCCLNAVLCDYARLGLLLAHDGNWRGRQIIPAAWVLEATTVHVDQPHLWPGLPCASRASICFLFRR